MRWPSAAGSTAVRTARRNLVQRIDRFVRRIQTEGRQPDPDAIVNFEAALECLERPSAAEPPIANLIERFERLRTK